MNQKDSFDEESCCFDSCDVFGDWDKVCESGESVKDNEDQVLVAVVMEGTCKVDS